MDDGIALMSCVRAFALFNTNLTVFNLKNTVILHQLLGGLFVKNKSLQLVHITKFRNKNDNPL